MINRKTHCRSDLINSKYTREQILSETEALTTLISETDEVNHFKKVEALIENNDKIHYLINEIKDLQKEAVNLQAYGKIKALKKVDAKIDSLQAEIDDLPIIQDFQESQVKINEMLQHITGTLLNEVTNGIEKQRNLL